MYSRLETLGGRTIIFLFLSKRSVRACASFQMRALPVFLPIM